MTRIERLTTDKLMETRIAAEEAGNWELMERCDEELERRDYDESDPSS